MRMVSNKKSFKHVKKKNFESQLFINAWAKKRVKRIVLSLLAKTWEKELMMLEIINKSYSPHMLKTTPTQHRIRRP